MIPPAPDYANPSSWLSSGETNSILPEFEVFYIYPTLFQNKLRPVMDHRFDRIRVKAADYLKLTFGLLTDPVHPFKLYAPFVRQADYGTALETDFAGDLGETLLRYGIEDTKTAFLYFLERFHTPGMPYILIGHSQGASDLYELLRDTPEITPESGFVAAYLPGLPKKTAEEFHSWEKKNASYKSFSGLLDNYLESKKIPSGEFFERSHIDRKLLSKIKTDFTYHPTKLTAIRACVGLDLTLEQAVELLETAGYTLSSASSFDLAIRFCLIKSITDIEIINGILTELEEPLLL